MAAQDGQIDATGAALIHEAPEEVPDGALAELVRNLADAVIICDAKGAIVFWNEAATSLFGWPADQVMGRSLDVIIPERQRAPHWEGYWRVMETGVTSYGDRLLEVPAMHRDGRRFSIAFTVSLLKRPGEQAPWGIAAVMRDDTTRFQERRELRQRISELEAAARAAD